MKTWKIAAAAALSIILAASLGLAQPANKPGRGMKCLQRFAALDANRDGRVSLTEFMAGSHLKGHDYAKAMFNSKDANGDGALTAAEFCPGKISFSK